MSVAAGPLTGVRVLDLGHYLAGPLAGMLLADQGADVVKIDPPGGPRFRHSTNAMLNRGKAFMELDLKSPAGRARFVELVRAADVLIENFSTGALDRLGLAPDDLRRENPHLIVASLPGFAPDDPAGDGVEAWEGIVAAATGQYTDIHAARGLFGLDPVYTALPLASVYAAVHAATAVVLALRERAAVGSGCRIVTPLANAAVSAMTSIHLAVERVPDRYAAPRLPAALRRLVLPAMRTVAHASPGSQPKLLDVARGSYPAFMRSYAASDGRQVYVFAIDNPKIVDAAVRALGLEDAVAELGLVREPPFSSGDRRDNLWETSNLARGVQAKLKERIAARIARSTAAEIEALLNAHGVPCAVQRTTREWLELGEVQAAGLAVEVPDAEYGPTVQPGVQTWFSDEVARDRRPAPRQAQAPGWRAGTRPVSEVAKAVRAPGDWLAGIVVLDLTSMVAGPVAGRTLAEYGARVVKVEAVRPNHGPRMTCWYGLDVNPGKESALIDLKTEDGRELVRRWVAGADVLLTNHLPEALERLGLVEDEFRAIRPDLIIARVGAYEGPLGGPWAARHGYDPVLQAASGIMVRYGSAAEPELHAIASCVDALTGYSMAFGIALALKSRDSDGRGRGVVTSLAAAAALVQAPFAVVHEGPNPPEASGQEARGEGPLYRLYHARDGWLFAAAPDAELGERAAALGLVGGRPERDLERAIRRRTVSGAVRWLRSCGVAAMPVRTVAELRKDMSARAGGLAPRAARHVLPSLGTVTQPVPTQVFVDGRGLRATGLAAKPGAHTDALVCAVGLDAQVLASKGATARELSRDYLPA